MKPHGAIMLFASVTVFNLSGAYAHCPDLSGAYLGQYVPQDPREHRYLELIQTGCEAIEFKVRITSRFKT